VSKHYQELKAKGVEFPVLDPDLASQTFIPEKVILHFSRIVTIWL